MTEIELGYVRIGAGQVHYRRRAAAVSQPTLVFLHQTASSSAMYMALMHALAGEFELLALDTPGYGNSFVPQQPPTMDDYGAWLVEALAGLGVGPAVLFGHHTGAAIAVQVAATQPKAVVGLILCGPPYLSKAQKSALAGSLQSAPPDSDGGHVLAVWQRLRKRAPNAPVALTTRELVLTLQAHQPSDSYRAVFAQPFGEQLAQISQPTLVICGEHDTVRASAEPTHAALANSQLVIVPNAGTYICDEQPASLARLIQQFFAAHTFHIEREG